MSWGAGSTCGERSVQPLSAKKQTGGTGSIVYVVKIDLERQTTDCIDGFEDRPAEKDDK